MKPDISEFSYAYALTSEFVRIFGLKSVGAPVFPSLQQEGRLGYDVKIPGIPLFLQFKLSDYMTRASANQADVLGVPHYRMHLRPLRHSDQHELLRDLEATDQLVYYAAAGFHTPGELNLAYDDGMVVERSAFWAPSAIGPLPDANDHYVAFRPGDPFGYLCSEPIRVEKTGVSTLLSVRVARQLESTRAHIPSPPYFRELADQLFGLYLRRRPLEDTSRAARRERDPLDDAAFVAQALFGCALLFALRT